MPVVKLTSWNVNGLRSIVKKGFSEWLEREKPDIVALQETKIDAAQMTPALREHKFYRSFFSHANRKGYSGVAIYSRIETKQVTEGMGIERFDQEGRILAADYGDFLLFNIYFPNGKANDISGTLTLFSTKPDQYSVCEQQKLQGIMISI